MSAQGNIVIISARPGQDVELTCSLGKARENIGWRIGGMGPYGVSALYNGILDGYSAHAHTTSIIILNIMMNDRNGTGYQCVIIDYNNVIQRVSDTTFLLYAAAAGEYILYIA